MKARTVQNLPMSELRVDDDLAIAFMGSCSPVVIVGGGGLG